MTYTAWALVFAFAIRRITRLLADDKLTERPRRWFLLRWPDTDETLRAHRFHAGATGPGVPGRYRWKPGRWMMTSQPAPEQVDGSGPYVNAPPEKNRHLRRVASLYDPAVGLWDQYPLRPATWAGRMFTCPWCLSVWVAIPVAVGWWAPGPQHGALRAVLTVAAALEGAGLLARLES